MRVNLGCGQAYMPGWVNVDASPDVKADLHMDLVDFVRLHGHEVEEVYMGHVLEHLMPGEARNGLRLLCEQLPAGAVVSAVTPDMRAIFREYEEGRLSNEELNASFIYSYVQPSHHVWCYDQQSLHDLFQEVGFLEVEAVDPATWEPVYWKEGDESRWQVGVKGRATGRRRTTSQEMAALENLPAVADTRGVPLEADEAVLAADLRLLRAGLVEERRRLAQLNVETAETRDAFERGRAEAAEARRRLEAAEASPFYRAARRARILVKRALPEGSRQRHVVLAAMQTRHELRAVKGRLHAVWSPTEGVQHAHVDYRAWAAAHDAAPEELAAQRATAQRLLDPVSVLVIVRGAAESADETLVSLLDQTWSAWRCVVIGGPAPQADDGRIEHLAQGEYAEQVNDAAAAAAEDFVILMDAGDVLAPDCLYHVAALVRQDPLVDLVTWDDDVLGADGVRSDPRFRPEWSPDVLLGADYIGRAFAVRRARLVLAGGLRGGLGEASTWDLLLRCDLDDERTARVPRVLAHLHQRVGRSDEAARLAVQQHLDRLNRPARVEISPHGLRIRWRPTVRPRVLIVIPSRHNTTLLEGCLGSLALTRYEALSVVIVNNGDRTPENEAWFVDRFPELELDVEWWDKPFNYSAVNNAAVGGREAEVLVFLNDDTEIVDPDWLEELVGWLQQPGVGTVGLHLLAGDGTLQHAGAVLGLGGFADHVFEGLPLGEDTMLGNTGWYRNALAVTGACVAVRREVFDEVGGFDERFELCGSDVALGLDVRALGLRTVCSPHTPVRHLESATRGSDVPLSDFFASYWRYQTSVRRGDPYFSPNVSLESRQPRLKPPGERTPDERFAEVLGRPFGVFRQQMSEADARLFSDMCRATEADTQAVVARHQQAQQPTDVKSVCWFIPDIDSPFYGGINTALRIADQLARDHDVQNHFVVWGSGPDYFVRSALAAAFPRLADAPISFYDGRADADLADLPPVDVAIATLWVTAYAVAKLRQVKRAFYLIQDFEPMFYPAGTMYALAEESYRLGLYGLCNTTNLAAIYRDDYAGSGMAFTPAVDTRVFHAEGRAARTSGSPVTIFVYARPGHWRNCWELASLALEELKDKHGDRVRLVTAGSWAVPEDDAARLDIKHLGLLDYQETGNLYRSCDIGLALTVSKHPSYLPLELMACGTATVAFDNPWGHWILRNDENSVLVKRTVDGLVDGLERLVLDAPLRERLAAQGCRDIAARHSDWSSALGGIYDYLRDPTSS